HGEAFRQHLEHAAPPAAEAEAPRKDGRRLPEPAEPEAEFVDRGIDPGVDGKEEGRDAASFPAVLGFDHACGPTETNADCRVVCTFSAHGPTRDYVPFSYSSTRT